MYVFTITLQNTTTGQVSPSMIVRKKTFAEVLDYVEDAIRDRAELRVQSITSRPA